MNEIPEQILYVFVRGIPVPQGSMKAFVVKGRPILTSTQKNLKPWRNQVAMEASSIYHNPVTDKPIAIVLEFKMPCPKSLPKTKWRLPAKRPDLDKLIRAILDSLTGVVFKDDSQVVTITAMKRYAYDGYPGVKIVINESNPYYGFDHGPHQWPKGRGK